MPARGLGRLQSDFAEAVLGGDGQAFAARLSGEPGLAQRRLALYRDAILANRAGALRAAFPVVARLVGDPFFEEAVRSYGAEEPPACADLNRHGATFPAFLASYPHAVALPWLADVARVEWAWQESLAAADAPGLDFAALARVPEGGEAQLRLILHPSVRLVRSAWPVLAIWEANQPERDGTPDRDEGEDAVIVWREAQRVRLALLSPAEAAFVDGLARGLALEEAAGAGDGGDFAATLARLAAHGMLAGFSAGAPATP